MSSGDQVVADASRYLGVPYLWGGTDPNVGLDCSGLVQLVGRDVGLSLPRTSQQQALVGAAVPDVASAQPGDLVFYGPASGPTHVGIYAGGGQMIDAPYTGTVVRVDPVGNPTEIRREVGGDPSSSSGAGSSAALAGVRLPGIPNVPGGAYLPALGGVGSITDDVKHAGAYMALVLAGLGLVVMGAIKTASPGTSVRDLPGKVLR